MIKTRPTMADVAKRADVSKTTVSHVIHGTRFVSDDTTRRVSAAITELGYVPSAVARSLVTKQTGTIGMVIPDASNYHFGEMVRGVDDIELPDGPERRKIIEYCRRLCEVGEAVGCRYIQMVSGVTFAGLPWATIRKETARGLGEMTDIAAEYGLVVSYEPLAWRTVWSVNQGLEVIAEAARPNIGLLVDGFHSFAGGDDLEAIRKLDPEMITTFHIGDAEHRQGDGWIDDDRTAFPGDGIVPLGEIARAVVDTGYDGLVSDEVYPRLFSDRSAKRIAATLKSKADAVLDSVSDTRG